MWFPVWLVIYAAVGGGFSTMQMKENMSFPTKEACERHIEEYEARASDFARGMLNASWAVMVKAKGACQQEGEPT